MSNPLLEASILLQQTQVRYTKKEMSSYNSSLASSSDFDHVHHLGVEEVWERCLSFFAGVLELHTINTWFKPIKPVKLEGSTLTIGVPTLYFSEYIEEHFTSIFAQALSEILGDKAMLIYEASIDSSSRDASKGSMSTISTDIRGNSAATISSEQADRSIAWQNTHLIESYTFDTFLSSVSNKVPRTFGLHICDKPGAPSLNPFFVYGAPGVGKTHLINAIGWQLLKKNPSLRVLYVSADNFIQQFTSAACNHKTADFTKFYRQIDVLLIDDIQSLIGKAKTQEAFFQIFNHLYLLGKQIVLTCDKPPVELHGMEERLLSRIAGSCTVLIERPDEELRRDILSRKMNEEGVTLKKEVVDLVIKHVTSNLRELNGALTSLMLHSVVERREIDLKFAKDIISRTVKMDAREITLDLILKHVSEYLRISIEDIRGKSRKQEFVLARQVVMYLTKKHTNESYSAIGLMLGGRSHATIVHGCRTIDEQISHNSLMSDVISAVERKIAL